VQCFIIIIIIFVVVFEGGIAERAVGHATTTDEGPKPNDIESAVRFTSTDGRCHLKISVLIALFVIPGGICNGIDVRDIYDFVP